MNERDPTVSIGLPVYDGELFLKSTLNRILSQSFRDIELIISDNASTDATPTICQVAARRIGGSGILGMLSTLARLGTTIACLSAPWQVL